MAETGRNVPVLALSAFLSLPFLAAGSAKLVGAEEALESFERFGYAPWFATFIGVCEVAGAIGLWIRPLAGLAAGGLAIIMLGAVYNHAVHDPFQQALPALVLGLLAATVCWLRLEDLPFGKRLARRESA